MTTFDSDTLQAIAVYGFQKGLEFGQSVALVCLVCILGCIVYHIISRR